MAKILFTHSYFLRFDEKQWKTSRPYPPLMTMQAAAIMRESGHDVGLHDVMFATGPEEILPVLETFKPDYLVLFDDGFNYLTKMCLTNMRHAAFEMSRFAKERGVKVISCSSDSTDHYEKYLRNHVDFVLIGEGEMTLRALIEAMENGKSSDTVAGIAFLNGEQLTKTDPRPVMRDLDALPMAAWDLLNVQPYQEAWKRHGYFSLNIATTRGCPFKCNWCAKPIYGNRYNSRSPERVIDEISYLLEHFQPQHFWMCDDIFGLKPGWVQEFNRIIQDRGLKFTYMIQSRVDLLLQEDTIEVLAASGCHTVWLGAESGSQRILDAMDKGTKLDQIFEARKKLKKYGINVAFFLQFGYLGETKEDIEATFAMLKKAMPDDIGVSVSYPLPEQSSMTR